MATTWYKGLLTVFAFAFLDQRLVLNVLMTRFAVEPGTKEIKFINYSQFVGYVYGCFWLALLY